MLYCFYMKLFTKRNKNGNSAEAPSDTQTVAREENFFIEIIKFALLAAVIVIPFRVYIAEPYIVQGASMSPTFETGHYLIIDKFTHKLNGPERGSVIVFKYPNDPSRFFVKRVIGLPGETVEIENRNVYVTPVNGQKTLLSEPYLKNMIPDNQITTLGPTEIFVMGDNRANSSDSRFWGPLDTNFIKGTAFLRLYPVDQVSLFPGLNNPL